MAQGQFANLNGLNLYYETYGSSANPLVLLHGGLGTIAMFERLLPALAQTRQVIAVELEGHGHTADIGRPLSFEQMGDDVAALVKHLGLDHADLMGYSLGGGAAIQATIRHPEIVHKLVAVSAPCKSNGWYPEALVGMRSMNAEMAKTWVGSPMHQAYASVAPDPDNWPAFVGKVAELLRKDYDWSKQVSALKTPTMIVVGDADGVRTAHAVEFFQLLGGGQRNVEWDGSGMSNARLAILPGTTHFDILASPILASVVTAFLDEPMPLRN